MSLVMSGCYSVPENKHTLRISELYFH